MGGERRPLEVRGIEDEAVPLGLLAEVASGLNEGLVLHKAHPAGDGDEAFALLEIGNGGSHLAYITIIR
jgi:hypothetical protein